MKSHPSICPLHPTRPPARSDRAREVALKFGLLNLLPPKTPRRPSIPWLHTILPLPGQITLLTGPSGAGKSTLLQAVLRKTRHTHLHLDQLKLPDQPIVDAFNIDLHETLNLLARVGLGEAWTYLRTPSELSEGQRWRLKLAVAFADPLRDLMIADEFAALLDRITARIVAHAFRELITKTTRRAILATSHTDLIDALKPDLVVNCDFHQVTITPSK